VLTSTEYRIDLRHVRVIQQVKSLGHHIETGGFAKWYIFQDPEVDIGEGWSSERVVSKSERPGEYRCPLADYRAAAIQSGDRSYFDVAEHTRNPIVLGRFARLSHRPTLRRSFSSDKYSPARYTPAVIGKTQ
jgi:hypothetical protein